MSETTNKSAADKRKSAATAAKTVAKGATEQATETKPDATLKVDETKPTESTPSTLSTGEADSKKEGDKDEGERSEGSTANGDDVGANDAGPVETGNSDVVNASTNLGDLDGVNHAATGGANDVALVGVQGAFIVTAKTDAGFWRSGIKFKRLEKTLVLVLDEDEDGVDDVEIVGYEPSQIVCLSVEKAKRVYSEAHLVVTDINLDELKVISTN